MRKKFFFLVWQKFFNFFVCFFSIFFRIFDLFWSARYDFLLVDDHDIGLALKLRALGADKPPSEQYLITRLEVEITWDK